MHRQSEGLVLEAARPAARPANALRQLADLIDRRPLLVLPVWIVAYFSVLWPAAHRPLWYDELFTYYVSMSPTWERFWGSVLHVDLNPPLGYLFVRLSIAVFGDTPFNARIPSMLAFLLASLLTSHLISQRWGGGFGLATLGIFWSFTLTSYAVEVRCYGILLAFFCIAALCWLNAIEFSHWTRLHTGLALALAAMFLTHCFSPPFAAAIGVGEIVRTVVTKRIDKRVWAALLAPLSILPLYIPLVRNAQQVLTPVAFQSTPISIPKFYLAILAPVLPAIGIILLYWLATHRKGDQVPWHELAKPHEIAFCIAAFLAPSITIGYCIYSGLPFWPRHGIGAVLAGTLLLAGLLTSVAKRNSRVAVAAAGLILILFCVTKAGTGKLAERYQNISTAYRTIRPELPFVTASGLTFLEMDHRESPEFIHRLYDLTDHESAVHYHTNIFEYLPILKQWFPIRANIESYRDFTGRNRQFLVLATRGFPEDWLLPKLDEDGADIRLLREENTGYRDRELYEVTLRP
jgi:hypothetical protein